MSETPLKDAGYLINEETGFLDDTVLDLGGSSLTAFTLGIIANMISKHGHVTVQNARITGEEIDWRPSLIGLKREGLKDG